jgi:5-methylcytosine-specific restriction endonuclease McrA
VAKHKEIYQTAEWERVRQFVIARANGMCELCWAKGIVMPGKEVDHVIELSDSNKNNWNIAYNPENLRLLCSSCHNERHNRSIGLQKFINPPQGTEIGP